MGEYSIGAFCREADITQPTFSRWHTQFGSLSVFEAQRLKALESENARLKRLLAERDMKVDVLIKAYLVKKP